MTVLRHWLVYDETTKWPPRAPAIVTVEPARRSGYRVEGPFAPEPSTAAGAVKALDEIVRVIDGIERGEPFGDEEVGTMDPLTYVGDVARSARGQ